MLRINYLLAFFILVSAVAAAVSLFSTAVVLAARQRTLLSSNHESCFYSAVNLANNVPNDIAVSVSAAAGLLNRAGPNVFTIRGHNEQEWQSDILGKYCTYESVTPEQVILRALDPTHFPKVIIYSDAEANRTLASVVTIAGVHGAVPLSASLHRQLSAKYPAQFKNVVVLLNTVGMWATIYDAVNWTMNPANGILAATTSLSFSQYSAIQSGVLVDLIVGGKYFAQGLPNACMPGSQGNALLQQFVAAAPWPRPIHVIGYNGEDPLFGGDVFEAETNCWGVHSMGQIASDGAQNLMFFSKLKPRNASLPRGSPQGPFSQPGPTPGVRYNASKKYVTLVYGDMDNLAFVQSFGRTHMKKRAEWCQQNKSSCFPFTWTLSPHLIDLAPTMMEWYYNRSSLTGGLDTFIMPPSGALYAYPSMMSSDVQAKYVSLQNRYANIMDTTGSIHWEWFFSWQNAFDSYFPRYIGADEPDTPTTKNFFLLSVPWPVPWLYKNYTNWIGNKSDPATNVMTAQKRFVWQAGGGGGENLTPLQAAQQIEAFEGGSTSYVYIIQNTPIEEVFACVAAITDPLVELVSYADLGVIARQKAVLEEQRSNKK